jgi:hypothetical protein
VLDDRKLQGERNTAAGGWGHSGDKAREPAVPLQDMDNLHRTLRSTEQRHKMLLHAFLKGLPDAANEVSSGELPVWHTCGCDTCSCFVSTGCMHMPSTSLPGGLGQHACISTCCLEPGAGWPLLGLFWVYMMLTAQADCATGLTLQLQCNLLSP